MKFFYKKGNFNPSISIVYGANGSGKTTISKAFHHLEMSDDSNLDNIDLIDYDSNVYKDFNFSIKVFNDDFINEKVKVSTTGLVTVIMFGEQVKLDDKIKAGKIRQQNS